MRELERVVWLRWAGKRFIVDVAGSVKVARPGSPGDRVICVIPGSLVVVEGEEGKRTS